MTSHNPDSNSYACWQLELPSVTSHTHTHTHEHRQRRREKERVRRSCWQRRHVTSLTVCPSLSVFNGILNYSLSLSLCLSSCSFSLLLFALFAQACQTVIKIYICILVFINVGPGKVFKMLNTPGGKLLLPPLPATCVPWLKPYPGRLLTPSPPKLLTLLFVLCHTHTFFGFRFNQLQKLINFLATQQMCKRAL